MYFPEGEKSLLFSSLFLFDEGAMSRMEALFCPFRDKKTPHLPGIAVSKRTAEPLWPFRGGLCGAKQASEARYPA